MNESASFYPPIELPERMWKFDTSCLKRGTYYADILHVRERGAEWILTCRGFHKNKTFYFETAVFKRDFPIVRPKFILRFEVVRKRIDGNLTPHFYNLKIA